MPTKLETVRADSREVTGLALSDVGKVVATAGADNTVKIWRSLKTPAHTLKGFDRPPRALAFTPNGKSLIVGGFDPEAKNGTVKLFDVETGKLRKSLVVGALPVEHMALFDEGRALVAATGFPLNALKVWNIDREEATRTIQLDAHASATALAVSPDGKQLAVGLFGSKFCHLVVYDLATGKEIYRAAEKPGVNMPVAIAFTPDGQTIATSTVGLTKPGEVRLYEAATGKLLGTLGPQRSFCLGFSPDGKMLATGENLSGRKPGTVDLFDVSTRKAMTSLKGHNDGVTNVAFLADGRLCSTSSDGMLILWRLR